MKEMKVFDIDGIKVSIPVDMYKEACRVYVLEEGNTEEEIRGNYLYLKNVIRAAYTPTLNDLGKITFENIRTEYSEKEISIKIIPLIIKSIEINGGHYDSTN